MFKAALFSIVLTSAVFACGSANAQCLSDQKIKQEVFQMFQKYFPTHQVEWNTQVGWTGAPARLFVVEAENRAAFRNCGLNLNESHFVHVSTVGEFTQVVAWALRNQ